MFELPLFPLNLVLFPRQSLALHIFEERYKQMIQECINEDKPFGIVLIEQGDEVSGVGRKPVKPYMIGCVAYISQVQPLTEGRMNIVVVGRERFRVVEFTHGRPYMTAIVEELPLNMDEATVPEDYVNRLRHCVRRYMTLLEQGGRMQAADRPMPDDPHALCVLAISILHDISPMQRQKLLEILDILMLFDELLVLYRREIVLLEAMLREPPDDSPSTFSLN